MLLYSYLISNISTLYNLCIYGYLVMNIQYNDKPGMLDCSIKENVIVIMLMCGSVRSYLCLIIV